MKENQPRQPRIQFKKIICKLSHVRFLCAIISVDLIIQQIPQKLQEINFIVIFRTCIISQSNDLQIHLNLGKDSKASLL